MTNNENKEGGAIFPHQIKYHKQKRNECKKGALRGFYGSINGTKILQKDPTKVYINRKLSKQNIP